MVVRALVIGGDGKLGRVLCTRLLERGHEVVRTTRRDDPASLPGEVWTGQHFPRTIHLDLHDPHLPPREAIEFVGQIWTIYIMAAITGILRCEEDPFAWRVNAEAPVLLAREAHRRGWRVVFMSSGTVERAPHTASARQKSYADLGVLLLGGCVVRPLPQVPPDRYVELADLLVDVGEQQRTGVVRWEF